jgi:hypothetical protein
MPKARSDGGRFPIMRSCSPREKRQTIHARNASTDSHDRQQALAAAALPPMPHPCLTYIREAERNLRQGLRLSKDPFREAFRALIQDLEKLEAEVKSYHDNDVIA